MERGRSLRDAVALAQQHGASYAEARYGRQRRSVTALADGEVASIGAEESSGWSIRVLVAGTWGFAARAGEQVALAELVERACEIARSGATPNAPIELAPAPVVTAEHQAIGTIDVDSLSDSERLDYLRTVDAAAGSAAGVVRRRVHMDLRRELTELVTSEGTQIAQDLGVVGGGVAVDADIRGRRATRSFPHHGGWDYASGGFEWFERIDLVDQAARVAREAVLLTDAAPCPTGVTTVVLDPTMVGTMLHETVGHATELDRILGLERDNFGSTFVRDGRIGDFPYGSPAVSVVADATFPGGAGSYGYDAEGVVARPVPLIEDGRLVGVMSSRDCAPAIGAESNGCARASSWSRFPMARMTNLVLLPGAFTLQELIADVDDGIYIQTDVTTDIDDNREMCAFGGEIGWRIRHGELAEVIARPTICSDTHSLLRQCDAVGDESELRLTGIAGCGKGQPWQFITTGQGGPPARFRNVSIGSAIDVDGRAGR